MTTKPLIYIYLLYSFIYNLADGLVMRDTRMKNRYRKEEGKKPTLRGTHQLFHAMRAETRNVSFERFIKNGN